MTLEPLNLFFFFFVACFVFIIRLDFRSAFSLRGLYGHGCRSGLFSFTVPCSVLHFPLFTSALTAQMKNTAWRERQKETRINLLLDVDEEFW
jgi:hypothetical protein